MDCAEPYLYNTVVTLSAAAASGSTFTGWSGPCTGTGACNVIMSNAQSVAASFTLNNYNLTIAKTGTGTGAVTSSPAGVNCGSTCVGSYSHGSAVTLSAAPNAGSAFSGWSGACSGSGACLVNMVSAQNVTANFTLNTYALTVTKSGGGTGTFPAHPRE